MDDKKRLKMAIIAGASRALRYKSQHRIIADEEVLRKVTESADEILNNID